MLITVNVINQLEEEGILLINEPEPERPGPYYVYHDKLKNNCTYLAIINLQDK